MKGLDSIRTSRFIGLLLSFFGAVLVIINSILLFVLSYAKVFLLPKANGMIKDGLALYNSFTGRLAVENISGHKELLAQLHGMKDLMPSDGLIGAAEVLVTLLLVLAVVIFFLGIFGLFSPNHFIPMLTKIKCLRWTDENKNETSTKKTNFFSRMTLKQKALFLGVPAGLVSLIFLIALIVHQVSPSAEKMAQDLEIHALEYVRAQKDYFSRNKSIGNASKLNLNDSASTAYFSFVVSSSKFTATSLTDVDKCPAGSRWTISATVDGLFNKDLKLYRKSPSDANCVKLVPDFKKIGSVSK